MNAPIQFRIIPRFSTSIIGMALLLSVGSATAHAAEPGKQLRVYFLGNSLTRGLSPDRLAGLCKASGTDLDYGTQLGQE